MKLAILAATGGTGRELVQQALERGHSVTALARDPSRMPFGEHPRLRRVRFDANDPASLLVAIDADTTVLSGLGIAKGEAPGVLTSGARAVLAARPARVIWLGAMGTGASARAGGWAVRRLLGLFMRAQLPDKVASDTAVLQSGGTVFHAGPLSNGPLSTTRRAVGLDAAPRRFFPAGVSRATVAALMLDEAESPRFAGRTAVALGQ